MERVISFLTSRLNKDIIESKCVKILDAFCVEGKFDNLPEAAGIYIMVAKKQEFVYPKKKSKVFYVGTSNNLKRRLKRHLALYKKACEDYEKHSEWIYGRYNYAVSFGADIYYMRITGREKEKSLESKVLECFYDKYGALPVGNGAFSFR